MAESRRGEATSLRRQCDVSATLERQRCRMSDSGAGGATAERRRSDGEATAERRRSDGGAAAARPSGRGATEAHRERARESGAAQPDHHGTAGAPRPDERGGATRPNPPDRKQPAAAERERYRRGQRRRGERDSGDSGDCASRQRPRTWPVQVPYMGGSHSGSNTFYGSCRAPPINEKRCN